MRLVRQDDHDQQQRGREHERAHGLDVRALEADVVDVEAQVHELALEVEERELAVERQARRELHHAHDHERRDLAGRARHREDQPGQDAGQRGGQDDAPAASRTWSRRARASPRARCAARRRDPPRWRRRRPARVSSASVRRGPEDPAGAEGRRRQAVREEERVDRPADAVDEEAQAEDAEHDRGHAGQVVHRDAHAAHEPALARVLAQVERGQHAERRHGDAGRAAPSAPCRRSPGRCRPRCSTRAARRRGTRPRARRRARACRPARARWPAPRARCARAGSAARGRRPCA